VAFDERQRFDSLLHLNNYMYVELDKLLYCDRMISHGQLYVLLKKVESPVDLFSELLAG
jgi:hypothetical protein